MKEVTLYKRNAKGDIIRWNINKLEDGTLSIAYGLFGHTPHIETINPTLVKTDEFTSRVKAKRKEGYKSLEDLYDNSPASASDNPRREENEMNNAFLYGYLKTYLPKNNTTSEGFVLPMLAKTLEDNKPFEKYGEMLGQWKINGLRCIIGAEKNEYDMFNPISLTYHSRTGENWTSNMRWMDEIILPKIEILLLELMIEEGACLDGELYLPGYPVNMINSFVKNPTLKEHYLLQYWCYDICVENMSAEKRKDIRENSISATLWTCCTKDKHLNNKEQIILLPTLPVSNIQSAITTRNEFIDCGFEGLILRNPTAEYQFGKRNQSMFKFKKKEDGIFEIVDIKIDKRGLPIYVIKNDINDECFECTINLPQKAQREQLVLKNVLIGKKGLVEYRERSGVKQVPFHAKLIKIYV